MQPGDRAQPDRPGDEHARQRRSLVRQRAAARRHPDHRQRTPRSRRCARSPPALVARAVQQDRPRPRVRRLRRAHRSRRFDLGSVARAAADRVLRGTARRCRSATARSQLIELGPAHTAGTRSSTCPTPDAVFTGDILFIEGTPIMWEGPVANWLAACDRILELDARVIVPGHGPVTDASGVRDVQRYLTLRARRGPRALRRRDGRRRRPPTTSTSPTSATGATRSASRSTSATLYREFDPSLPRVPVPEQFVRMARWSARHGR